MAVQDAPTLAVREYEPADERAVVDLLGLAFGRWPTAIDADAHEFFAWKTARCPFGVSRSWLAESEGELVGFIAQLPWRMRVADRALLAIRGTDLAVHPAHRGRGVAQEMLRVAMAEQRKDIELSWNNPNTMSRKSVLKVGRRKSVSVPRFIRAGAAPARTLARALGRDRSKIGRRALAEIAAPAATEVLSDDRFIAALLERAPHETTRYTTELSVDYLRWRYAFDDYRAIRVGGDADGGGIAIFRVRPSGALWLAHVCELIAPRASAGRELVRRVGRAAGVDMTACAFPSHRQAARYGTPVRAGAIELVVRAARDDLPVDPMRSDAWALSLGDLELL
jgi:GNAT superfamily N-acetyltransferase